MNIDPRLTFWFGVWTSVLLLVASGTINFTGALPADWVPILTKWCAILGAINSTILTALAGVSSNKPGPLSNSPVLPVVKPVIILAVLVLSSLFLFPRDASAQIKVRLPDPLKLNQPAPVAPAAATRTTSDPLARVMDQLAAVQQKVVDGVVADIMAADADAASLTNPADPTSFKDPISHACYPAGIKFLQSLPVATAPTGEFILVQLFQKKRDFIAQIRAGLPVYLKLGCAPLLGDEAAIFTKLIGLVGVKVGLDALAPGLGLAMPVL